MKKGDVVFDLKGNEYIYECSTEVGHLVYPVYVYQTWPDGMFEEEKSDKMELLKEVYPSAPIPKLNEIIKEQREQILSNNEAIKRFKSEIEKDAKTMLQDKLKEIKGADTLIEALTGEYKLYLLENGVPREFNYGVVGLDLQDGSIKYLCNEPYSKEYREASLEGKYTSLEEVERVALDRVKHGQYPRFIWGNKEVDKLFDKYHEERPESWINYLKEIDRKQKEEKELEILRKEKHIKEEQEKLLQLKREFNKETI